MLAASHGRMAMVHPLLDCGADPSMRDHSGATALMCACEQGHTDVARMLLECARCDAGVTDDVSRVAHACAHRCRHTTRTSEGGGHVRQHGCVRVRYDPQAQVPLVKYPR